jgi:hypothetical protein
VADYSRRQRPIKHGRLQSPDEGGQPGLFTQAGTTSRNLFPEQRKRSRQTPHSDCGVLEEKRPKFRQKQRLLVPAYGFMNNPG